MKKKAAESARAGDAAHTVKPTANDGMSDNPDIMNMPTNQ
jgi:hypothetical protein